MAHDALDEQRPESVEANGKRILRLSNGQILLIVLIILGIQMAIDFSKRIIDGQQKIAELNRLQAQVALLEVERRQLETEKTYYSSESYVIEWAHSEGKMVLPGEILVIPVYDLEAQSAVLTETNPDEDEITQEDIPFALWWGLFFDSEPPFTNN